MGVDLLSGYRYKTILKISLTRNNILSILFTDHLSVCWIKCLCTYRYDWMSGLRLWRLVFSQLQLIVLLTDCCILLHSPCCDLWSTGSDLWPNIRHLPTSSQYFKQHNGNIWKLWKVSPIHLFPLGIIQLLILEGIIILILRNKGIEYYSPQHCYRLSSFHWLAIQWWSVQRKNRRYY
jgi:hypothetical protein